MRGFHAQKESIKKHLGPNHGPGVDEDMSTQKYLSPTPHSVSGNQSQLGAVFQEDAACILLGVDPDTVVRDDGAGMETVERLKI